MESAPHFYSALSLFITVLVTTPSTCHIPELSPLDLEIRQVLQSIRDGPTVSEWKQTPHTKATFLYFLHSQDRMDFSKVLNTPSKAAKDSPKLMYPVQTNLKGCGPLWIVPEPRDDGEDIIEYIIPSAFHRKHIVGKANLGRIIIILKKEDLEGSPPKISQYIKNLFGKMEEGVARSVGLVVLDKEPKQLLKSAVQQMEGQLGKEDPALVLLNTILKKRHILGYDEIKHIPKVLEDICGHLHPKDASLLESTMTYWITNKGKEWLSKAVKRMDERMESSLAWALSYIQNKTLRYIDTERNENLVRSSVQKVTEGLTLILNGLEGRNIKDLKHLCRHLITTGQEARLPITHSFFTEIMEKEKDLNLLARMEGGSQSTFSARSAIPYLHATLKTLNPQSEWYTFLSSGYNCLVTPPTNGSKPKALPTISTTDYTTFVDSVAGECQGKVTKPKGVVPQGRTMSSQIQQFAIHARQGPLVTNECGNRPGYEYLHVISGEIIVVNDEVPGPTNCEIDEILITATVKVDLDRDFTHKGNGSIVIMAPKIEITGKKGTIRLNPELLDKPGPYPSPPFVDAKEVDICKEYCDIIHKTDESDEYADPEENAACKKRCDEAVGTPEGPCALVDFFLWRDLNESEHGRMSLHSQSLILIYDTIEVTPGEEIKFDIESTGGPGGDGQNGSSTKCGWTGVRGVGAPGGFPGYVHLISFDPTNNKGEAVILLKKGERGNDGHPGYVETGRNATIWEDPDKPLPPEFYEPLPVSHNFSRTLLLGLQLGFNTSANKVDYFAFINKYLKDERVMQYFKSMELGKLAIFVKEVNKTMLLDAKQMKDYYEALWLHLDNYLLRDLEYRVPSLDCGRPLFIPHEPRQCNSSWRAVVDPKAWPEGEAEKKNYYGPPEKSNQTREFVETIYEVVGGLLGSDTLAPVSHPVDVSHYLDYTLAILQDEEEDYEDQVVADATRKYEEEINGKVVEIRKWISTYFLPQLDISVQEVRKEVLQSTPVIQAYKNTSSDEIIKLKDSYHMSWVYTVVGAVCEVASVLVYIFLSATLGPVGTIIAMGALGAVSYGAEKLDTYTADVDHARQLMRGLDAAMKDVNFKSTKDTVAELDMVGGKIEMKLAAMEEAKDESLEEIVLIRPVVKKFKEFKDADVKDRKVIKTAITNVTDTLKTYITKFENDKKYADNVKFFEGITKRLNIIKTGGGDLHTYTHFKGDDEAVAVLNEQVEAIQAGVEPKSYTDIPKLPEGSPSYRDTMDGLKKQMDNLNKLEDTINDYMVPMIEDVGESFKAMYTEKDISEAAIVLRKHDVRRLIKPMRQQLIEATKIKTDNRIGALVDSMDNIMTNIVQLQDEIAKYTNHKNLVMFLGNLTLQQNVEGPKVELTPEQQEIVDELKGDPRSKTLKFLWVYNKAVSTFKHQVFPLAEKYATDFLMPISELEQGDASVRTQMIRNIRSVNNTILLHRSSIVVNTTDLHKFESFYNTATGVTKPFYVWEYDKHEESIKDFMSGKPVMFYAEVAESPKDYNAIKFKIIELEITLTANPGDQDDLRDKLKNALNFFKIRMKHSGTNYYRVDDKYYKFLSPAFSVNYSFEKDTLNTTLPRGRSGVYEKLYNGYFSLSPYTAWVLQLDSFVKGNFTTLQEILEEKPNVKINLELCGEGMYIDDDGLQKLTEVDTYYDEDVDTGRVKGIKVF